MKKLKHLFGAFLIIGSLSTMNAQTSATLVEKYELKPGEVGIPYEKWRLPNGLTIIIHEDHSDPIVHVEMTYKVGSNREVRGKTGFAHFFEHMMFQGSKHVADEEHFKIVQGAGGEMNGTTNQDRTNYYETLPSNQLEVALWLEADRMGFLLDSVTKEKFEVQRATVKNEKSQNIENQPYALAFTEVLAQKLYPVGHPYSWPTIGYVEDLDSVTVEDLKKFFMRWYGPNNAILAVTGDIDTKEVLKLVEKYFGSFKAGKEVRKLRVEPVVLPTRIMHEQPDNIYAPLHLITYPTVPNYHKDEAPLDILSQIIGGGVNSPLYKAIVKTEKGLQVGASNACTELAGNFQIFVAHAPPPKNTKKEVLDIVDNIINTFDPNAITDEQITISKKQFEVGFINAFSSVQEKASMLTQWEMLVGNYSIEREISRYNNVTRADLVRVFNQYIKNANPLILSVVPKQPGMRDTIKSFNPDGHLTRAELKERLTIREKALEKEYDGLTYSVPVDNFDRSKKPTVNAAKPVMVPDYYEAKTENGIKIIGTKTTESPMVNFFINIEGGHLMEAYEPKKMGLASITAKMMNEGTEKYTVEQLETELNKIGSSIFISSGTSSTSVSVSSLVSNVDKTMEILEEMMFRPRFTEEAFKRVKNESEESYYSNNRVAAVIAGKAYAKLLNGEESILGAPTEGTASTIKNISLSDVKEFYNKYYSAHLASVVVVGNIDKDAAVAKLKFLEKWKSTAAVVPPITPNPGFAKTEIYVIDKINAPTSEIRIGFPSNKFDYNGEYFKSRVMNFPLGGNFNSRINLKLREEKGWTYGARTGFSGGRLTGSFTFSASVKTKATDSAVRELVAMIEAFKKGGLTDEELNFTKVALREADALRYESDFAKASFLSQIMEYNLPKDFVAQQNALLKSLTKEELNALAQKLLTTDRMVIVIVGDREYIIKGLESLGYGKIKTIDPDKNSVKPIK